MARVLVVFHPFSGGRSRRGLLDGLCADLCAGGHDVERVETLEACREDGRVRETIHGGLWDLVVAAGGDGTVRDVVEALLELPSTTRPPLAIVALGTANNAARAMDPTLARQEANPGRRLLTILSAPKSQMVDAGLANGRAFLGSVAMGMDADILAWRNTWRPRCPTMLAGYPLYLASCAVNALRAHGGPVQASVDGRAWTMAPSPEAVNVLITNTALHAGEFRFACGERHRDGFLDVVWNPTMGDYLRRYAAAWPRHVRVGRGWPARDDRSLVCTEALTLEWKQPMAWQLDGEEMPATERLEVSVLREALTILVSAPA